MRFTTKTLIFVFFFGFGAAHSAIRIVATTQDLASIAQSIGGEKIEVQSLTSGTRDPHFAEAKPSMIRKVFKADLLLLVGADMEIGWLPALLQSGRNSDVQVGGSGHLDLSNSVRLLDKPQGAIDRSMGDVHTKGNPHYWLDPRNGINMSKAIAERLSELDPENKQFYQSQQIVFENKLNQKFKEWRNLLSPLRGQSVIAYHKSLIYLADAFEFNIVGEVEPKPGIAPSAGQLNHLVDLIRKENVSLLIMEPYYEKRSSEYLSKQTKINVAVLPQSVKSMPNIENYFDLFDGIVLSLKKAGGF